MVAEGEVIRGISVFGAEMAARWVQLPCMLSVEIQKSAVCYGSVLDYLRVPEAEVA
jgi:hypothetical protein